MSRLPIVQVNLNALKLSEIALRCKSIEVDIENKHTQAVVQQLIEDLFETLYEAHPTAGVGISAPQVGVLLRVSLIDYTEENEDQDHRIVRTNYQYVLINPRFTYKSEDTVKSRESCLSFPTLIGEVERSLSVRVEAYDHNFVKREIDATGWLARVFQHEIDHLDGILYADRIGALEDLKSIDFPYVRKTRGIIKKLYGKEK